MANKPTPLDALIGKAVGIVQQLERMDQKKKLTFGAFLDDAISLAGTTREKVEKLGVDLDTKPGMDPARAFVSKLVRVFREPNYPRCPRDSGKVLNCYGSSEAFQALTSLGATVGEAMAVAVLRVHKKFGDDAFGAIKNLNKYVKEYTTHRERIAAIYGEMKDVVSGADLAWSQEGLFQDEIARGLGRTTFKRAPAIGPHHGDWPRELVAACAKAPKTKRETLPKTKAA